MFELRLLVPEERVEIVGEALDELDALSVSVEDARAGDRLEIAVAPGRALDAFYHPFAYAA